MKNYINIFYIVLYLILVISCEKEIDDTAIINEEDDTIIENNTNEEVEDSLILEDYNIEDITFSVKEDLNNFNYNSLLIGEINVSNLFFLTIVNESMNLFELEGDELFLKENVSLDYEDKTSHTIIVEGRDINYENPKQFNVVIDVLNVSPEAVVTTYDTFNTIYRDSPIAIDNDGFLYSTNNISGEIYKYDHLGNKSLYYKIEGCSNIVEMKIGDDGVFYIVTTCETEGLKFLTLSPTKNIRSFFKLRTNDSNDSDQNFNSTTVTDIALITTASSNSTNIYLYTSQGAFIVYSSSESVSAEEVEGLVKGSTNDDLILKRTKNTAIGFGGTIYEAKSSSITSINEFEEITKTGDSYLDGNLNSSYFNKPEGIAIDDEGNTYISDSKNNCIRFYDVNKNVSTIAGRGPEGNNSFNGDVDASGTGARFNYPTDIVVEKNGAYLFVHDKINKKIKKITFKD